MMLYICTKFHENIHTVFSYRADTIFIHKISKGDFFFFANGVTILVLGTSDDDALHLYQVS